MSRGSEVKQLREALGMNRREFCDYYGIPYRTVQDWECGKRELPEYVLRLMIYKAEVNNIYTDHTQRKVSIIEDLDGKRIVVIHDIRFKGRRSINWNEVKEYLKRYVGDVYEILDSNNRIYIGVDLPNEYSGSKYTYSLKGATAKAKANASQGIPELIEIATSEHFRENSKEKHSRNAKYGWYRFDSYFALPVYDTSGDLERYNVFHASLLVRHDENGKKYLYDILDIKKETGNPLES